MIAEPPVKPKNVRCYRCGSKPRVETFGPNQTIETAMDLWFCSDASPFGGECEDSKAFLSPERWIEVNHLTATPEAVLNAVDAVQSGIASLEADLKLIVGKTEKSDDWSIDVRVADLKALVAVSAQHARLVRSLEVLGSQQDVSEHEYVKVIDEDRYAAMRLLEQMHEDDAYDVDHELYGVRIRMEMGQEDSHPYVQAMATQRIALMKLVGQE